MNSPYKPITDVRKTLRPNWYRCPVDPTAFRELMKPNDYQGWFQAGGHLAIFATTAAATIYFFLNQQWLSLLIAPFIHGTSASFFKGMAAHELALKTSYVRWYSML